MAKKEGGIKVEQGISGILKDITMALSVLLSIGVA